MPNRNMRRSLAKPKRRGQRHLLALRKNPHEFARSIEQLRSKSNDGRSIRRFFQVDAKRSHHTQKGPPAKILRVHHGIPSGAQQMRRRVKNDERIPPASVVRYHEERRRASKLARSLDAANEYPRKRSMNAPARVRREPPIEEGIFSGLDHGENSGGFAFRARAFTRNAVSGAQGSYSAGPGRDHDETIARPRCSILRNFEVTARSVTLSPLRLRMTRPMSA